MESLGSRIRVVWHYRSTDEDRTFTITYRVQGTVVAYDDVVDVNLKIWGDEWEFALDHLGAEMLLPDGAVAGDVLVWGHAATADGATDLGTDEVSPHLEATGVPDRQFVEFRVVFPRRLLATTDGATVVEAPGLDGILAEETALEVRDAEAIDAAERFVHERNVTLWTLLFLMLSIPVALVWGFRRYGKEPEVEYDQDYEHSMPTDHYPAVVGALVSQGAADEAEFTATLFDLIRKGVFTAKPVMVEHRTWGCVKREMISDLEIGFSGEGPSLKAYERSVYTVVKRMVCDGSQPLIKFRKKIREDAAANATTYTSFREKVGQAVVSAGLLEKKSRFRAPRMVLLAFFAIGVVSWFVGTPLLDAMIEPIDLFLLRFGIVVITAFALILTLGLSARRSIWIRRTPQGALANAKWLAFKRYLEDFSHLEEAPPISLVLWENYLVYGIALGVADDVLEAARLGAPEAVHDSSLYWYGTHGYGGHSSNAISGIASALSGAFTPPSSSGGGGGFSGGGGGGGGGAW